MWPAAIAVLGTLAGVIITHQLDSQRARREARDRDRRDHDRLTFDTVVTLSSALAAHRRAMWVERTAALEGGDHTTALEATYITRAAITAPHTAARLRLPTQLAALADDAVHAVFAMHDADSTDDLKARRVTALTAADTFIHAAADHVR